MPTQRSTLWICCLLGYFALAVFTWVAVWQGWFVIAVFLGAPPRFVREALLAAVPPGWPIPVWGFAVVVICQAGVAVLVWCLRQAQTGVRHILARFLNVLLLVTASLMAIGCLIEVAF